ncbi:MAG: hypothetical protein M3Q08_01650 [Pseudomonadota bacterium]|nr:hypothetical protein [Pseudomonadota bacterium]
MIRPHKFALAYHREDGSLEPGLAIEDPLTGRYGYFGGILMDEEGGFHLSLRRWPVEGRRRSEMMPLATAGDLLDRLRVRFEFPYATETSA